MDIFYFIYYFLLNSYGVKRSLWILFYRALYTSIILIKKELSSKNYNIREKAAEYFINKLHNDKFLKILQMLEEDAQKIRQKDKPEKVKVKWDGEGKKEKTAEQRG